MGRIFPILDGCCVFRILGGSLGLSVGSAAVVVSGRPSFLRLPHQCFLPIRIKLGKIGNHSRINFYFSCKTVFCYVGKLKTRSKDNCRKGKINKIALKQPNGCTYCEASKHRMKKRFKRNTIDSLYCVTF